MAIFPLLALGGAGAAVVVTAKDGTAPDQTAQASAQQAATIRPTIGNGFRPGATIGQLLAVAPPPVKAPSIATKRLGMTLATSAVLKMTPADTQNTSSLSSQADALVKQKLDAINAYAKQAYDQLSKDAKQKGADYLNSSLGLNPPIKADASYEEIASAVGGAAGAAAGAYIGGPVGAKIGAIVGAYLGVKLEELINKDLDKIGDWFKSQWNDVTDWVGDEASSAASSVGNWLGSIF